MNKKIYKILEPYKTDYKSPINGGVSSNSALFEIFDTFFHKHKDSNIKIKDGLILKHVICGNIQVSHFNIIDNAYNQNGISFLFEFNNIELTLQFHARIEGARHFFNIEIICLNDTDYTKDFIYKYILYSALELSKLKGSYFTMPRDEFDWDVKELEKRGFNDVFLPDGITEDLKLYDKIFDKTGKVLRYLMVGNPGTAKTESGIVLANTLNEAGVTIIKTPICKQLHKKVELANVLAPSLLIFDDIDLSLGNRNSGGFSQLLGDFLDVLDGTDKLANNVGVIATTNAAHLLDLAAQRPGRFDKTLLFDDITKDNIKNIIIKSLKNNFGLVDNNDKSVIMYTTKQIVDKFHEAGVSGSHIFNTIKMLKLRYDTLDITKTLTPSIIIKSIEDEIKIIDKVRKTSYLNEKYDRASGKIGFDMGEPEDEDYGILIEN